ncbi:MAG: PEP-CTERM system TPR-repeat protein PrsT [Gammaproteobacteria bacterium]|nr:PEP-CTERM system TPR-repeat protein PrsT [Gammaproteobacteria bacterium]
MSLKLASRSAIIATTFLFLAGCAKTADQLFQDATAREAKGDRAGALIDLKSALQQDPNNGAMRFMAGRLYNATFDPVNAENELRKAGKLGVVENGRLVVELARSLRAQQKFAQLLKEITPDKAFAAPQLATLYALRGRAQHVLGYVEDAELSLKTGNSIGADNPDVDLLDAQIKAGKGDFEGALAAAERALSTHQNDFDAWTYKAELLRELKRDDDAINAYGEVLKLNIINFRALKARSMLYLAMGKLTQAQKDADLLARVYPQNPEALTQRGILQLAQGNPKLALESARAALKNVPDFADAKLLSGLVYRALGSLAQSEDFLSKYLAGQPDSSFARRALADTLLGLDQPARAVEILEPLLKNRANDPRLWALAGDAYLRSGDSAKAMEWFDKAATADPKDADIQIKHALATIDTGKGDLGLDELADALELTKDASRADEMLILSLLARKEVEKTDAALQKLEKRAPKDPITSNLKGLVLLAKNDREAANKAFEEALKQKPGFFPAAANAAQLDLAAGKPKDARARYAGVLTADDKSVQAMLAIADLDLQLGQRKEAIEMLERAAKAAPNSMQPRLLLIALYNAVGDKKRVTATAEEALAANPENPQAIMLAAEAELSEGNTNKAIATYGNLVRLDPDSTDAQVQLARFQARVGAPEDAESTLRRLLDRHPTPAAQIALISLLVAEKRIDDAMAYAKQMQKAQMKAPLGYALEGEVFEATKKFTEAATAYDTALRLQPMGQFAVKRFLARARGGDQKAALVELEHWADAYPEDFIARAKVGDAFMAAGDYKTAAANYEITVKGKQVPLDVANNLAWAYYQLKDKRALEMAETALKANPNSGLTADTFGWILVEQGDVARGLGNLKRAVALAPEEADIRYHLAAALAKSGDSAGARSELERLLKSDKPFATRKDAEALLASLK